MIIAADDDAIDLHHIVDRYQQIRDARLAIIPHTSHLLHHEAPDTVAGIIRHFLDDDEPHRMMPMRTVVKTPADQE